LIAKIKGGEQGLCSRRTQLIFICIIFLCPASEGVGALSDAAIPPSVCPSVYMKALCFYGNVKMCVLAYGQNAEMLEVEPIDQCDPMTTESGQNGLDLEQFTSSISP